MQLAQRCIFVAVAALSGGKLALHPLQGEGGQPTERALVLQEGGATRDPDTRVFACLFDLLRVLLTWYSR